MTGDLVVELVGAFLSGLVGVGIALFTIHRQNKAARAERSQLLRGSLSAEIGNLLTQVRVIISSDRSPIDVMSALGAVNIRVYPGLITELGVLGSDMAAKVIAFYGHLEHVIEHGEQIRRRPPGDADLDARSFERHTQHCPHITWIVGVRVD